jgi:hypothetical protein
MVLHVSEWITKDLHIELHAWLHVQLHSSLHHYTWQITCLLQDISRESLPHHASPPPPGPAPHVSSPLPPLHAPTLPCSSTRARLPPPPHSGGEWGGVGGREQRRDAAEATACIGQSVLALAPKRTYKCRCACAARVRLLENGSGDRPQGLLDGVTRLHWLSRGTAG